MSMQYENTGTLAPVKGFTRADWDYIDGVAQSFTVE